MAQKDYYDILGVPKNASDDDIKRAFRKLAHQYHPDKTGGDDAKFKEINSAYQVLGDAAKRQKYDQFGHGFDQMGGGGGFGGFGGFGQDGANFDFSNLGEMFGDIFGQQGGRSQRREERGRHIEMDVKLDFKEAAFGVEKNVEIYKTLACADCSGSGAEKNSKVIDCVQCGGQGQVRVTQRTILGTIQSVATCPRCAGQGRVPERACGSCKGSGVKKGTKEISIKIPAGIDDGEIMRLTGEGEAAPHGGRSGDLYVTARITPNKIFGRDGFDVHSKVEVPFPQASLGGVLEVETIDGPADLKIPAGTQPGQAFRLKNKGVPFLKRTGRGDHLVEVEVAVPTKLTKGQRKALENWENL